MGFTAFSLRLRVSTMQFQSLGFGRQRTEDVKNAEDVKDEGSEEEDEVESVCFLRGNPLFVLLVRFAYSR